MIQNVHRYALSDRIDDEIFEHTMKAFPELADPPYEKLVKLDEEWMKNPDGKQRWRNFIERWDFFCLFFAYCFFSPDMDMYADCPVLSLSLSLQLQG